MPGNSALVLPLPAASSRRGTDTPATAGVIRTGGDYPCGMGELLPFHRSVDDPVRPEPLWREAVGEQLREERRALSERLADVAGRAGVSTQYLSELERGLKEPSSEVLAALAGALRLTVADLTTRAVVRLRTAPSLRGPVCQAA